MVHCLGTSCLSWCTVWEPLVCYGALFGNLWSVMMHCLGTSCLLWCTVWKPLVCYGALSGNLWSSPLLPTSLLISYPHPLTLFQTKPHTLTFFRPYFHLPSQFHILPSKFHLLPSLISSPSLPTLTSFPPYLLSSLPSPPSLPISYIHIIQFRSLTLTYHPSYLLRSPTSLPIFYPHLLPLSLCLVRD